MFIDIPKEEMLPVIEKELREILKATGLEGWDNFIADFDSIEWTENGIRVWIQKEN